MAVIRVLASTGLRLAEVVNLRRADVDLAKRLAYIPHGKGDAHRPVSWAGRGRRAACGGRSTRDRRDASWTRPASAPILAPRPLRVARNPETDLPEGALVAPPPNRRDLIKMGAVAGGIAVAGPIVTTFNVPAAAALTSACTCTGGHTLWRKEAFWNGTGWATDTTPDGGACAPGCYTGATLLTNGAVNTGPATPNSPRPVARGPLCDGTDEGVFAVTAVHTDGTCVGPGNGSIAFTPPTGATVTAAAGKTLSRVFIVACCTIL